MYCVVCGAQVPDGLGRCAICGSEIAPGSAAASGSAVQPAPQPAPQPASQPIPQPSGRAPRRGPSARSVIAALVSAAVVAIVGGGACFAFGVFGNEPLFGGGAGRVDAAVSEPVNALSEKATTHIEEAVREEAERAAREAEERARAEEEARLAEQTAQREQTALDFAMQYYTNGSFVSADDDTRLQPIDNDTWQGLVLQYLEPGSAAVATFESMFSGPINGLGAFSFVKDARVVESSADRVAVEVRYLATQNPVPGWSNAEGHVTVFTCAFAESGLIDSYSVSP